MSLVGLGAAKADSPETQARTEAAQPQAKTKAKETAIVAINQHPTAAQREVWRKSMVRTPRPKKGCFTATYPANKWTEVQCKTPPPIPFRPRKGVRPFTVGNGVDFSAQVTANTTAAEGTFDSVTGVTSETGGGTANAYSLQLNTNFFSTTTCSGASNPGACQGWEQFIYSSNTMKMAFIQYWMIGYNNPCPSGWNSDGGGDCFINNAGGVPVATQPITQLANMTVTGDTTDEVIYTVGASMFTSPGDNHFPDLANGWRVSEFNIVGDGGGGSATFNAGSSMVVRTRVNSGMPATPPTCDMTGFTGETNNLTLSTTPAVEPDVNWPSIIFTQTNNSPTAASCDNADSIGDTHLHTFAGLLYDFQASGDFVLSTAPNFEVQTRQASGAPSWPNAAVNKAVATQMGKTRVDLYIEPTRLVIDGRSENLADGKDLLLPTGVQVSRRGNLYAITSSDGNSVRAVLNSTWIDVHLGLGHAPTPQPRGLLGNPNGDHQLLATASGAVLRAPVAFADLYHGYADSWRVKPNESLFTAPTTIKPGIPTQPFFAAHLTPQQRTRALGICKAAGVKAPDLLEACTLDNAVLNDKVAAKVFVHAPVPRFVLKPVVREPILKETAAHATP